MDPLLRRLRELVATRTPVDEREESSIAAFCAHVDALVARGADPLDQRSDPIHITGSGVVIGARGVLLLEHRRLGIWLQPGGHIDPGETPWAAARRETLEETGLAVDFLDVGADGVPRLVHVDVHAGGRGHTHLDLRYLLGGTDDDPDPPPEESQQVAWFDWSTATDLADPGLAGLLRTLAGPDRRAPVRGGGRAERTGRE